MEIDGYENKKVLKIQKEEFEGLKEYKEAYYCLLEYWESFGKEQQKQINKDLNKIFKLNVSEQVDLD